MHDCLWVVCVRDVLTHAQYISALLNEELNLFIITFVGQLSQSHSIWDLIRAKTTYFSEANCSSRS